MGALTKPPNVSVSSLAAPEQPRPNGGRLPITKHPQNVSSNTPKPPPQVAKAQEVVASGSFSPPSPPPESPVADLSEDPLYILAGELTENPVIVDGAVNETRLTEVLQRLFDGGARKSKDWVAAWQAMFIPVERQAEVLQKFFNIAFLRAEEMEKAPATVVELLKHHKVRLKSVEEVLVSFGHNVDGILAMNEEAWHVYAFFLCNVFPKPAGSGWGWSRIGWSWQGWWQCLERCVSSLDGAKAFDVIAMVMRLIQDREGCGLAQAWEGDKLHRVLSKLQELLACESSLVIEKLALAGVNTDGVF